MYTAATVIYTLSLHDALPICAARAGAGRGRDDLRGRVEPGARVSGEAGLEATGCLLRRRTGVLHHARSEEHTSELQSLTNLVCRLLLEKKNTATPAGPGIE